MADESLPPFGVRGLCSPDKPFSVLQVSESQYNASLHSYPDSALTWLDEDDGELVTIGSGSELKDRLNDPIPHSNPRITFHDKFGTRKDDQYIHLFDISGSQTSLDVWKEHEAYFSKTQSPMQRSLVSSPEPEQDEVDEVKVDEQSAVSSEAIQAEEQVASDMTEDLVEAAEGPQTKLDKSTLPDLFGSLGFRLDHIAGFLQGTSDTLRKAADKTRECDTSPIEDIISGMTTVLGEVGAFGLDVLNQLDETTSSANEAIPETNFTDQQAVRRSLARITDDYLKSADEYYKDSTHSKTATASCFSDEEDNIRQVCSDLLVDENVVQDIAKLQDTVDAHGSCPEPAIVRDVECLILIQLLALNRLEASEAEAKEVPRLHNTKVLSKNEIYQRRHDRYELLQTLYTKPESAHNNNAFKSPSTVQQETNNHVPITPMPLTQVPILDQETDAIDAAFSARYPPLMSLRKVKTLDVLRPVDKTDLPNRTASIKQDHTGKPRPQIFDAETLRRRDFAKTCFPAQEYTPGPDATTHTLTRPKSTVWVTAEAVSPMDDDDDDDNLSEIIDTESRDSTEHNTAPAQNEFMMKPHETFKVNSSLADYNHAFAAALEDSHAAQETPGAWPESNVDSIKTTTITTREDAEPMKPAKILPAKQQYEPSSIVAPRPLSLHRSIHHAHHRLQRHRSLMNPALQAPTTNGLHRSQSVTATNPSARLTGPFSPLFPAPVAPQSFSDQARLLHSSNVFNRPSNSLHDHKPATYEFKMPAAFPHTAIGQEQSQSRPVTGPVRSLNRSASDRRPRSLYEPYRPNNGPRAFEPVWEGSDEPTKQVDPNPGVVIVDASYFKPGTTEQDIRDLLADDCRTAIGINTLISCRIVANEPQVVAKLVIKDKTNADTVINKYNGRCVGGQPLKFEYATTGIDARINRIRGALPALQGPQPRHLRSVPDLRRATKPSFATFTSQAKSIVPPETVSKENKPAMSQASLPCQPVLPPAFAGNLIHECESKLAAMGYGDSDVALLSRLHVYACAAKGDVHEAIEMIEEDRKANDFDAFQKKIQQAREERWGNHDDEDDEDSYEEDLQQAIKLSMKEQ